MLFGGIFQIRKGAVEIGAWLACYVTFQLHMIARLDDMTKFRLPELEPFFLSKFEMTQGTRSGGRGVWAFLRKPFPF